MRRYIPYILIALLVLAGTALAGVFLLGQPTATGDANAAIWRPTTTTTIPLAARVSALERRVAALEAAIGTTTTTLAPTTTTLAPTTTTLAPTTTTAKPTTTTAPTTTTTMPPTTTTKPPTTTTSVEATTTTTTPTPSTSTTTTVGGGAMTVRTTGTVLRSGSIVTDIIFKSSDYTAGLTGISGSGINGATLRNVRFENNTCGMKIGSGSQSTNINADGLQSVGSFGAMFLANVSDSTFRNLDLSCIFIPNAQSGYKNHVIYLERGNHNLSFYDVKSTGGSSWPIHLYNYETANQPSTDILFDGLEVDCQVGAIVISEGYQRVTIKNLKATAGGDFPVIQLYGAAKDIVIDGFECWGGSALVGLASGKAAPVNVTLRNGLYHGPTLPMLPGVTYENVRVVG